MKFLLMTAVAVFALCGVAFAVEPTPTPGEKPINVWPRPQHPGAHNPAPRPGWQPYYVPPRYPAPYYVVVNGRWVLVYPSPYVRPYYPAYPPHYQPRPYAPYPSPFVHPRPQGPGKWPIHSS